MRFAAIFLIAGLSACANSGAKIDAWSDTASYNIGKWSDDTSSWFERNYAALTGEENAKEEDEFVQLTPVPAPQLEVQELAPIDSPKPSAEYGIAQNVHTPALTMKQEYYYDESERGHSFGN